MADSRKKSRKEKLEEKIRKSYIVNLKNAEKAMERLMTYVTKSPTGLPKTSEVYQEYVMGSREYTLQEVLEDHMTTLQDLLVGAEKLHKLTCRADFNPDPAGK